MKCDGTGDWDLILLVKQNLKLIRLYQVICIVHQVLVVNEMLDIENQNQLKHDLMDQFKIYETEVAH